MKLSLAIIVAAPAVVAGKRLKATKELPTADIKATSKTGNRILSKARRLDDGGDGDAMSWVAGYSLKFHSCVANQNYYGGWFANDNNGAQGNYAYNGGQYYQQDQGNNYQNGQYANQAYGNNGQNYGNGYYNNENRNDFQGVYQQKLVHFKLCPSDSCWSCKNGADYVVELGDYVDAIMEAKMTAQEYNCERVKENCWCENANYQQQCLWNCYKNANMNDCMVENENDQQFDVQEALECSQLEVEDEDALRSFLYTSMVKNAQQNQNQNGYYAQNGQQNGQQQQQVDKVYVGPTCDANGKGIHLAIFLEETCSVPAPDGLYEAVNYGTHLPYSKKSGKGLVDSGCVSCKEPKEVDYNNYWDQQDPDEVTDVCSRLYEEAGKCEENLDGYFPYRDNYGCALIKSMKSSFLSAPRNVTAKVFAGIFAATTALLAGVAAVLFKRNRRQNVSLAGDAIIS